MKRQSKRFYVFGAFRIDVTDRLLFRDSRAVPLTPKAFDTLLFLVENSGRVLGREEIMTEVWPDSFVEENNLAQNISSLRKALGPAGSKLIETVPKRGYRFVGDVTETSNDAPGAVIRERTRARVVIEEDTEDDDDPRDVLEEGSSRQLKAAALKIPETMYATWQGLATIVGMNYCVACAPIFRKRLNGSAGAKSIWLAIVRWRFLMDQHVPFAPRVQ